MKKTLTFFLFLFITVTSIAQITTKQRDIVLVDKMRNRKIPITLYIPKKIHNIPLVIINHGYNENKPDSNKSYSFIAKELASQGCMVASIQHELPTDELLPKTGDIQSSRKVFFERGAENIYAVIEHMKKRYRRLNFDETIIIGHSMGGDMAATFTKKHPEMLYKLITLDNRRVPLPRISVPKIYSLRSSDQSADAGVIPSEEEQKKYSITIQKLHNTIHNDMNDNANDSQKREMLNWLLKFLSQE
ncbi:MAG: alpha/beta hydrolase [Limnohabitans sp.]|nr:alpha/beta hydrolase [Limnohabitans sp.]